MFCCVVWCGMVCGMVWCSGGFVVGLFVVCGVAPRSCVVTLCRVGRRWVLWRRVVAAFRRVAACAVLFRCVVLGVVVLFCWLCPIVVPCSSVGSCCVVSWCGSPVVLWWPASCGVVVCLVVLLRAVLCGVGVCVVSRYAVLLRCCVVLYGCVGRLCVFVHTTLCHVLLPSVV